MKSFVALAVGTVMVGSALFAQDAKTLINRPVGVQNIKYENEVISKMIIVGKAAVPRALRYNPGKAAEYGRKKAERNAKEQFIQFLSTKCKWGTNSNGETVVKAAAASSTDANGKENRAESSSFTETEVTKEQSEQMAQACVSAVQVIAEGLSDDACYTWVGAWDARAVKSIKAMAKMINEANAEVSDMGEAAKAKKAAEDAKELEAIRNGKVQPGKNGGSSTGSGASASGSNGGDRVDILKGKNKLESTVSSDAKDFL